MFDVHILSIYVDICYISVLIKYFFPVEICFDCIWMKESYETPSNERQFVQI